MYAPKSIRYIILVGLIVAAPVHSNSLLSTCIKGFASGVTEKIGNSIINASTSTQKKITVGVALVVVSYLIYLFISNSIRKRDAAFFSDRNVNIDYVKGSSSVYLREAVKNNDAPLVYKLLKYGASLDRYHSKNNPNVLEVAISKDHVLLALILRNLKHVDKEVVKSALHFAIEKSGQSESAYKSIEVIVRDNKYLAQNEDVVCCAALNGPKVLHAIKNLGKLKQADLNRALFNLVEQGSVKNKRDAAELLIEQGADIHAKEVRRWAVEEVTPIADAILVGSLPMVQFFSEKGSSLEIVSGKNAYDYVEKADYFRGRIKEKMCFILDNHRRKIANKYTQEACTAINAHLFAGPSSIVMEYVEPVYPLMGKRPLESFELVREELE